MTHNGVQELGEDFPGVARELARMVLPVATYSQMYWKGNLHNLFHFLNLRCDAHAQYEIRVFADAILDLIRPHVPWAVEAFEDYLLHASRLSRMETVFIQEMLANLESTNEELAESQDDFPFPLSMTVKKRMEELGCSKREIDDFIAKFTK
jgi:thymidylate synthase (FAD)